MENISAKVGLSNDYSSNGSIKAISGSVPLWLQDIALSYEGDIQIQMIIQQLTVSADAQADYTFQQGILRYKGIIVLGNGNGIRKQVFSVLHDSAIGGHSGIQATIKRLQKYFTWVGCTADVKKWVSECDICQRNKTETVPYPGLLQPLEVPTKPWTDIAMDFIEGLPTSEGKNVILVVVDRFSKFGHFISLKHPFTAINVAKVFVENIYRLHGFPQTIVSDRDKIFLSNFWQSLFQQVGVKLCMSSFYHPQSDGQTERLNKCLECFLRCMCSDQPKKWVCWLPLAQWWYNTTFHTSLKCSPFKVLFGFDPPQLNFQQVERTKVAAVDEFLKERSSVLQDLRTKLLQAQHRMKFFADQHRSEREFSVGDFVYLKLQPYRQSSLVQRSNLKLAARYYGPFEIVERIGTVAYKLKLPSYSQIHNVFHVSLLKKTIGCHSVICPTLPPVADDGKFKLVPEKVLGKRMVKYNNMPKVEYLIQWSGCLEDDAMWEDAQQMVTQFPEFDFHDVHSSA